MKQGNTTAPSIWSSCSRMDWNSSFIVFYSKLPQTVSFQVIFRVFCLKNANSCGQTPPVRHQSLPVLHERALVREGSSQVDQQSLPVRHGSLLLCRERALVRHGRLLLRHGSSQVCQQKLPVRHGSSPVRDGNLPVDRQSPPVVGLVCIRFVGTCFAIF